MAAKRCPAATWLEIADTVEAAADAAAMLAGRQRMGLALRVMGATLS
jgi:hypothetical protein